MRVLICTSLFDVATGGGAARSAFLTAAQLRKAGHDVRVITSGRADGFERRSDGIEVQSLSPRNIYWIGSKNSKPIALRALWQLIDIANPLISRVVGTSIREFRPDVVHTQKLRGLSPSVWAAASAAGVPVVHTARDYELLSPEGTLTGRIGRMVLRRSRVTAAYAAPRRRLSRHVTVATAPSQFTLDLHAAHGFFGNAHKCVLPNSHGLCDSELVQLPAVARSHTDPRLHLLYVGRLESTKGVATLCETVDRLSTSGAPLSLTVAGWGTMRDVLHRTYAHCKSIRFAGPQFGHALHDLYAAADVLVVPSQWHEVFGNVVVEAAARGVPAIVSTMGGLPELVHDGVTGWHFDATRPGDLERAILAALDGRSSLRVMQTACRDAAQQFTVDKLLVRLIDVYSRAIGTTG